MLSFQVCTRVIKERNRTSLLGCALMDRDCNLNHILSASRKFNFFTAYFVEGGSSIDKQNMCFNIEIVIASGKLDLFFFVFCICY